jgi:mannose-6-phosphate isomerase-like protein (cupin superfamily)
LNPDESAHIPVGAKHRLSNPERDDVVLIEVQTGTYFGEDDIERFEDDFGRVDEDTSASKRTGNSSFRT